MSEDPYHELLNALQEPMRRLGERLLEQSIESIREELKAYCEILASRLTPRVGQVVSIGKAVELNIALPVTPVKVVRLAGVAATVSSASGALTVERAAREVLQTITLTDLAMLIALLSVAAVIMLSVLEGDPVRRNVESLRDTIAFLIAVYALGRRS